MIISSSLLERKRVIHEAVLRSINYRYSLQCLQSSFLQYDIVVFLSRESTYLSILLKKAVVNGIHC